MSRISDCRIIQFPKVHDCRGNLTFIEEGTHAPFKIERVYLIYDVPGGESRGEHAFKAQQEIIISLAGSFDLLVDDGSDRWRFSLNRSYFGVYVPNMLWRKIENFSSNSVCLSLASTPYRQEDYIKDYAEYLRLVSEAKGQ